MGDYEHVGGSLLLKSHKKKKKKKSHKTAKHPDKEEKALKEAIKYETEEQDQDEEVVEMTEAERAFAKAQAKREAMRIKQKAAKTHREKVQELNRKLDTMTEHHDIPKVSWTK
eukprot:gene10314-2458_t